MVSRSCAALYLTQGDRDLIYMIILLTPIRNRNRHQPRPPVYPPPVDSRPKGECPRVLKIMCRAVSYSKGIAKKYEKPCGTKLVSLFFFVVLMRVIRVNNAFAQYTFTRVPFVCLNHHSPRHPAMLLPPDQRGVLLGGRQQRSAVRRGPKPLREGRDPPGLGRRSQSRQAGRGGRNDRGTVGVLCRQVNKTKT